MAGVMETLRTRAGRQIVANLQAMKGGGSFSVGERAKRDAGASQRTPPDGRTGLPPR